MVTSAPPRQAHDRDTAVVVSGSWLRGRFEKLRSRASSPLAPEAIARSAMVFAPHYDDETLGCGGMIAMKCRAGALCRIVFMTDSSASHGPGADRAQLSRRRRNEAHAAGRVLGVADQDIVSLSFPDQHLEKHAAEATDRVEALLREGCPEQIFIPHSNEPLIWSSDHRAATSIVKAAASRIGREFEIFEYPVWLWFGYPWVDLRMRPRYELRPLLRATLSGALGVRLALTCTFELNISDVLERKRAAIAAYRSQLGEPAGTPSLADVAGGQFLDWFLRPVEVFARCRGDGR